MGKVASIDCIQKMDMTTGRVSCYFFKSGLALITLIDMLPAIIRLETND